MPLRLAREHLCHRHRARHDLGVDVGLADAPRDQLRVLRAEVDDENDVVVGTRSRSVARLTVAASPAHADALRTLQRLALGLQRRRDHHLGLLELLERLVAGGGHRRAQRAEEVERAVVLVRGTDEDLGQRGPVDPRSPARRAAASGGTWPCPSGTRGRAPRRPRRAASRSSPRRRRTRSPWRRRRRCACPPSAMTCTYTPVSSR